MLMSWFWCVYYGHVRECPCFQEVHAEVFKNNGHHVCTVFKHDSGKKYMSLCTYVHKERERE